jgi:hypothetical protein
MPIVVKTRTYDQDFYDALRSHPAASNGSASSPDEKDEEMRELFY